MTQLLDIFKCSVCGNVAEITHASYGALVCCDEEMKKLDEHSAPKDNPHFAHIEHVDDLQKKIYFNHPMTGEHHIEYIEVISNDGKYLKRKNLKEDEPAELNFKCECKEGFYVRLYCNKDGVWKTEDRG